MSDELLDLYAERFVALGYWAVLKVPFEKYVCDPERYDARYVFLTMGDGGLVSFGGVEREVLV